MPEEKPGIKEVKLAFDDEMPTVYPSHLVAQHDDQEFTLNFFRIHPPLLVGTSEEKAAKLEELDKVRAQGLVRIVVPASRMAEFMKVLEQNFKTFGESAAAREAEAKK